MKDTPRHSYPTDEPHRDRLLSEKSVIEEKLDDEISGRTLDRWILTRGFPQPIRLSGQKRLWRESAIDQWIAEREAASQRSNNQDHRPAGLRRRRENPSQALTA
jgi:predicted DNA-binding transcriptional regulator AlpA